jgi:hypothetical protein
MNSPRRHQQSNQIIHHATTSALGKLQVQISMVMVVIYRFMGNVVVCPRSIASLMGLFKHHLLTATHDLQVSFWGIMLCKNKQVSH